MIKPPAWMLDGICCQVGAIRNLDWWFPPLGDNGREGKKVCKGCPVRQQCLHYAVDTEQQYGIWGGLSYRQRLAYQRARKEAA